MARLIRWCLALAATFVPVFTLAGQEILIPVTPGRAVSGAFGTEWKTELWVYNRGLTPAMLTPRPGLAGEGFVVPPQRSVELSNFDEVANGRALILDGAGASGVRLQLQVREITRGDMSSVTVPTVTLDSFSAEPTQLLNIPAQHQFRTTVRIYALFSSSSPADFTVRLYDMEHDGDPVQERHVSVAAPAGLPPNYVDTPVGVIVLSDFLDGVREIPHARLEIAADRSAEHRFWAFASVTNNATQHVLIVVP